MTRALNSVAKGTLVLRKITEIYTFLFLNSFLPGANQE